MPSACLPIPSLEDWTYHRSQMRIVMRGGGLGTDRVEYLEDRSERGLRSEE